MQSFYSQRETREAYQRMVDSEESSQPATEGALMRAVVDLRPSSVLEVGCGSGRIYQRLRAQGCRSSYTGVELSAEVVRENMRRFPEGNWLCGSGYDLPLRDASQDCVFAYYVLEHCVFPERFLRSLLRVTRPGGSLILAFPDFHVAGLFGSQRLGLSEGNAREHMQAGRVLHACVAFWDSRVRLPRALQRARQTVGPFPVNLSPKCFDHAIKIEPDVDALYISSRKEVVEWAARQRLQTAFPGGQEGILRANVLIQLKRVSTDAEQRVNEMLAGRGY